MSSVDDRIVQMQFDNDQFQRGVADTNDSLDNLKDHLQLDGATDGLNSIQRTADSMNLGTIADAVSHISSAFSALGVIGINVLSSITQGALNAGKNMAAALTEPLIEGGKARAIALEQAQFQFRGLGLDITATMASAKAAVLGTAFGLQDAATAAAQFGASGITAGHGLESALGGIAGVAAQSGQSFGQIANVFEKVAGQGRLMGEDLNSLASDGINAAATLGKALGKTEPQIREMVSQGKISFKQFSDAMNKTFGANASKANETFTGALANMKAAVSRIGADIFTPLDEAERKIFNAASPLIDNIHTALGPILTAFGTIENLQSGKFVTFLSTLDLKPLSEVAPGVAIALSNIYLMVVGIAKALGHGFSEIFPPVTVSQAIAISNALVNFTQHLIPSEAAAEDLKNTFAGLFAVIHIGLTIFFDLIKLIGDLLGFTTSGAGGVLSLTGSIGEFLVKVDHAVTGGTALNKFFIGLEKVLKAPITLVKLFAEGIEFLIDAIEDLVTRDSVSKFADRSSGKFEDLIKIGQFFQTVWEGIVKVFNVLTAIVAPYINVLNGIVKRVAKTVADALSHLNFAGAIAIVNTGLFAGLVTGINGFFGNFGNIISGNVLGIKQNFNILFRALQVNLKALQINTNAKTLKELAVAIALIAASAIALSFVDPVKLGAAMGAIGVGFGEMVGSFAIIAKSSKQTDVLKVIGIATSFVILAIAIDILSVAIISLSKLSWEEIGQGMLAIGGAIAILIAATAILGQDSVKTSEGTINLLILAAALKVLASAIIDVSKLSIKELVKGLLGIGVAMALLIDFVDRIGNPLKLLPTAVAIIALAGAMKVLASVVKDFGELSVKDLVKGLAALGAVMYIIADGLDALPKNLLVSGAGLTLVAASLKILASVIVTLGKLTVKELAKGLITIGAALLILSVGLEEMDGTIAGSLALLIAAAALYVITGAIKQFAKMSWDEIGRALVLLGASLAILAIALTVMGDPLVLLGAAALFVAAAGLGIMAPALKILGSMSWDDIGRGLTILAAGIVVLAIGGLLLIPAIPGLLALGIAIGLMGLGLLAAGVGIGIFAAGLALLGQAGPAAINQIGPAIEAFLAELPKIAVALGLALGTFAATISTQGPAMIEAFTTVLVSLITALTNLIPPIVELITTLIVALINQITILLPLLVQSGLTILQGILQGISDHIEAIVDLAIEIVANFINGIADGLPTLLQAGVNLVLSFINGMADTIRNNTDKFNTAGNNLAGAIIDGMTSGIRNGVNNVIKAITGVASGAIDTAKKLLGIHSPSKVFKEEIGQQISQGMADGIESYGHVVEKSATTVGQSAISAVQKSIAGINDAVANNMDMTPMIRPILDLTQVKKSSSQISGLLNTGMSLSVDAVSANAIAANTGIETNRVSTDADGTPNGGNGDTVINQNNYSPKAISPGETYRQTKSALALAKKGGDV